MSNKFLSYSLSTILDRFIKFYNDPMNYKYDAKTKKTKRWDGLKKGETSFKDMAIHFDIP